MKRVYFAILLFLMTSGIALASQYWLGGFASGFSWSDESAHYVNGLLIYDWVRAGAPLGMVAFARDYYMHFPKVLIGQWPPLYYGVEALAFMIAGHGPETAIALQAIFVGTLGVLVGNAVLTVSGPIAAVIAALAAVTSPYILTNIQGVMLDVPLACVMFGASMAWAKYLTSGSWRWSLAFAATAAAAILIKGNGFCLALLPPLTLLIERDWRVLQRWTFWLPVPVVAILVGPWYLLTQRMLDGFGYTWGIDFTALATVQYGSEIPEYIGPIGLLFACIGAFQVVARGAAAKGDAYCTTALALVLSVLLFHFLVPMNIINRYVVGIVPGLIVLAVRGIEWLRPRFPARLGPVLVPILFALVIIGEPAAQPKHALAMREAADYIFHAASSTPFILIGGTPNAEGSFVAALANEDRQRRFYAVRGFSVLGKGDLLGDDYKPRFQSDDAAASWIDQSGIGWVVIDYSDSSLAWKHNAQLAAIAAEKRPGWSEAARFETGYSRIRVYRLEAQDDAVSRSSLLEELAPSKALNLGLGKM
jgi:hypothetical protein